MSAKTTTDEMKDTATALIVMW